MTPEQITVWACPACGYWRQNEATGVHAAPDPQNPSGPFVTHELVETTYSRLATEDSE